MSRTGRLTLMAGAIGTLAAAHAVPATTTFGPMRKRLFPGLSGRGDAGHVAMTFDDGPDPESTPQFLRVLAGLQVTSTRSWELKEVELAFAFADENHVTCVPLDRIAATYRQE